MRSRGAFAVALAAAVACGPAARATPDAAKLVLDPSSKEGVILFRAPVLMTKYNLSFRREKEGHGDYERVYIHSSPRTGPRYIAVKVKPGRWAVNGLSQQDRWIVCYWKDVPTFEVRPGHITFVGEWDAELALERLGEIAIRRGNTVSEGIRFFRYWDDDQAPALRRGDDPALRRDAEAFARSGMPGARLPFADPAFATVQKERRPGKGC